MKRLIPVLIALSLLLCGCTSAVREDYAPEAGERLVIYTSHKEDVYRPIIREFEERTGIWVELVTGGSNELLERIAQEKAAPKADIMFGGGVESLDSHRELFSSAHCSEIQQIDPAFRESGDTWTPFSALPVVLIYNTMLVAPGNLTCWQDLLRPEFQGKIAFANPARSGSSFTALVTAAYACGEDILLPLASQLQGSLLSSSGDVLTQVADGTCLVGITLEETALQRIAAGDNIALVYPSDGTSCVPDGTAVVLGAPHEANAIRFLEFTLSPEVQRLLGSRFFRRSVRVDAAAPESLPALSEINLVNYNPRWAAEHREEILTMWDGWMKEAAK